MQAACQPASVRTSRQRRMPYLLRASSGYTRAVPSAAPGLRPCRTASVASPCHDQDQAGSMAEAGDPRAFYTACTDLIEATLRSIPLVCRTPRPVDQPLCFPRVQLCQAASRASLHMVCGVSPCDPSTLPAPDVRPSCSETRLTR